VIYAMYGKMRGREVLKMRKKREFPVIKLMLTKGKLDKIVVLCFRYIVMRKNNFGRNRNEEKEKTG